MLPREKRTFRKVLFIVALALCVVVLLLRTQFAWDNACALARRELPALLGLEVGINSCEIDPLTQKVTLRGLSAFEQGADEPVFFADSAEISLRAVKLTGGVELDRVAITRPRIEYDLSKPRPDKGEGRCPLDS